MPNQIGPGASWQSFSDVQKRPLQFGTTFMPSHKLTAITQSGVQLEDKSGKIIDLEVDHIVFSLGVKADHTLFSSLKKSFDKVIPIGDTLQVGQIANAVSTGYTYAYQLD